MGHLIPELTTLVSALAVFLGVAKSLWRLSRDPASRAPSLYARLEMFLAEVRNNQKLHADLDISNRALMVSNNDRQRLMEEIERQDKYIAELEERALSLERLTGSASGHSESASRSTPRRRRTSRST